MKMLQVLSVVAVIVVSGTAYGQISQPVTNRSGRTTGVIHSGPTEIRIYSPNGQLQSRINRPLGGEMQHSTRPVQVQRVRPAWEMNYGRPHHFTLRNPSTETPEQKAQRLKESEETNAEVHRLVEESRKPREITTDEFYALQQAWLEREEQKEKDLHKKPPKQKIHKGPSKRLNLTQPRSNGIR